MELLFEKWEYDIVKEKWEAGPTKYLFHIPSKMGLRDLKDVEEISLESDASDADPPTHSTSDQ